MLARVVPMPNLTSAVGAPGSNLTTATRRMHRTANKYKDIAPERLALDRDALTIELAPLLELDFALWREAGRVAARQAEIAAEFAPLRPRSRQPGASSFAAAAAHPMNVFVVANDEPRSHHSTQASTIPQNLRGFLKPSTIRRPHLASPPD